MVFSDYTVITTLSISDEQQSQPWSSSVPASVRTMRFKHLTRESLEAKEFNTLFQTIHDYISDHSLPYKLDKNKHGLPCSIHFLDHDKVFIPIGHLLSKDEIGECVQGLDKKIKVGIFYNRITQEAHKCIYNKSVLQNYYNPTAERHARMEYKILDTFKSQPQLAALYYQTIPAPTPYHDFTAVSQYYKSYTEKVGRDLFEQFEEITALPLIEKINLLLPVAELVEVFHAASYCYLDLRLENVVAKLRKGSDGQKHLVKACLIDFGRMIEVKTPFSNDILPASSYCAPPECLISVTTKNAFAFDAWAFGALMYQIFKGKLRPALHKIHISDMSDEDRKVLEKSYQFYKEAIVVPDEGAQIAKELQGFLTLLLHSNPRLRPDFKEIVKALKIWQSLLNLSAEHKKEA